MAVLGKLKKIDLREAWKHEALDFTQWLAKDENLALLSEEIGVDINLIETEANVGSFNVDIFAEDSNGRKIVIENQLESTNHDHLGKIITYASGYNAEIIIWIVKDVRNEHKQAIDWLNEHTDEKINFFAIKLELWQIDGSPYAPKFQIISKPNEWAKIMKAPISLLTERKLKLLDFWTALNGYLNNKNSEINPQKPSSDHWNNISVGTSKAHISLTALAKEKKIGCEFYIPDNKELYFYLVEHKEEIEQIFGQELYWQELKGKKASRISISRDNFNLYEDNDWEKDFDWFENNAIRLKKAICPFLKII
ncbi:MAG: DUF4268 domain-containing protein [Clostridium sp.]|nr:DUF4268 domain-containing protein [Clostridium sp.]